MTNLYSNDKVRECAERIVSTDIFACASYMVSAITGNDAYEACRLLDIDYEDELMPLLESLDWEEAAKYHIDCMDADDLRSYLDEQGVDYEAPVDEDDADEDNPVAEGTSLAEMKVLALDAAEEQDWQIFCSEFNIEPDRNEVYEHWIVSSWLAGKLSERGHPTGEMLGFTLWGRCTTGQRISMDGVILEIANELLNA